MHAAKHDHVRVAHVASIARQLQRVANKIRDLEISGR